MFQAHAHELKQQGVLEAARDPRSPVTNEDAERAMVEDTRSAGGAAFHFDPNASPQEKAAQARANIPKDFHHERIPIMSNLATDTDTGPALDYELPPARDDTSSVATFQSANGHATEDPRWARDRTGWQPRSGGGDPKDDGGPTLIDHQTWVETRLEDIYYGDWYYNAGVIIFACLSSYVIALLGGGLAWVFLIMATCGTYYRTSLRRVRRNFRDDIRREMAKTRLETDTESLEWINSFLVKFWPIFAPVLCDSIITSVDQVLSTSTPVFLDSLRLKTFILGTKPPRLEHVKTYPKTEDDVVMMDWKFSFNPNDVADLTSRQIKNKINPKVALEIRVGVGIVSKGFDVLVEDMACSGLMRVKLKLRIPFPHIEKAEICFIGRPTFDYVCKPLGGDTFGFDINFIPGLESFIQEQIHANIGPIMYEPNVFPIEIAKLLAGSAVDRAIGVVQISLHGAQGLKNPDKFPGVPDPYVQLSINDREVLAQSKTVEQNANPRFNETFNLIVSSFGDNLTFHVYDYNEFRKDKDLGLATFSLDQLAVETVHESQQLEVVVNGAPRGIIEADVRFFPVQDEEKGEDGIPDSALEWTTGIARFTIEQAKDLDGSRNTIGQLNPYAVLLLNGKEVHTSQTLKRTNNPVFPNATKELLITNRSTAKLGLAIRDDRGLGTDQVIGTYQVKLDTLLDLVSKGQEWFNLAGARIGKAKMTVQWRPVALTGPTASSGGYRTPIGVMRFHFHNARDLRNVEGLRKSDPFVRVLLSGVAKARTVTHHNNLNPDFDEILYVPMHSPRERITLEVMDHQPSGKDRPLGLAEIAAAEFIHLGENGEYPAHDRKTVTAPLKLTAKGTAKGTLHYTCSFFPTYFVDEPHDEKTEPQSAVSTAISMLSSEFIGASTSASNAMSSVTSFAKSIESPRRSDVSREGLSKDGSKRVPRPSPPKIKLDSGALQQYECGLLVFKLVDAEFAHSDCAVEVVMDDMLYPSFTSSTASAKQMTFNETGDAMVRELDFSKLTIKIRRKADKGGEDKEDHIYAKLTGQTLAVLQRHLYQTLPLTLKGNDGRENKIHVHLKYLPIKMELDQSESITNMGALRCEVLDATDLPAADRNGFSDPYCNFLLNGNPVFKTQVQKKTLHPSWNEFFEVPVPARSTGVLKIECYDYDRTNQDDFLGAAEFKLALLEPFSTKEVTLGLDGKSGTVRIKMLFKPDYVIRAQRGSSATFSATFSGTFAAPGKIIGAPVKGVGKGAAMVGGNIARGASFVAKGFRRRKTDAQNDLQEVDDDDDEPMPVEKKVSNHSQRHEIPTIVAPDNLGLQASHSHARVSSPGPASAALLTSGHGEPGSATFTIASGQGYAGHNIRVVIKQQIGKGMKEVFKTKLTKASADGRLQWDDTETFKASCSSGTAFSVQVKDVHTFGQDEDLGQGSLLLNGPPEQTVQCGKGTIVIRTEFRPLPATDGASSISGEKNEASPRNFFRKSFHQRDRSGGVMRREKDVRPSMDVERA